LVQGRENDGGDKCGIPFICAVNAIEFAPNHFTASKKRTPLSPAEKSQQGKFANEGRQVGVDVDERSAG
jgi:hypothetical protein